MDICEIAMLMELDGKTFYQRLAQESNTPGLSRIFTMLAEEERDHFDLLERLQMEQPEEMSKSKILENTIEILFSMNEAKQDLHFDKTRDISKFRMACVIEMMSGILYLSMAKSAKMKMEEKIFLRLAECEATHLRVLENIVEFVACPENGNCIENAEWHLFDNY